MSQVRIPVKAPIREACINIEAFVDIVIHSASDEDLREMIRYADRSSDDEKGCNLCHSYKGQHVDICPVVLLGCFFTACDENEAFPSEKH